MKKSKPVAVSERDYEAEYDCDTLLRAEEIRNDKPRYARALKAVERKKKDLEKALARADGLRK